MTKCEHCEAEFKNSGALELHRAEHRSKAVNDHFDLLGRVMEAKRQGVEVDELQY